MKKAIFSIVFLGLIQFTAFPQFSQSCLPNGITFYNQQKINNFQVEYPNCTKIEGNLVINGDNIINLNNLYVLNALGGSLSILNNPSLLNLNGLENISSLGGSVVISNNESLTNLSGIGNIDQSTINNLKISNNPSLSLCEVENICNYLENPNGSVTIYNNDTGCNSPPEIAQSCDMILPCLPFGNYYFYEQAQIDSFQVDYQDCNELNGEVVIAGTDITNLLGFENVYTAYGNITIEGPPNNYRLHSLSGLNNLNRVFGSMAINGDSISSLEGIRNLKSVGGRLLLWGCGSLQSLTGLGNLSSVGGLKIGNCFGLTNFLGLDNLKTISEDFSVVWNKKIVDLKGFEAIDSIGGSLSILAHPNLVNLSGLDNLTYIGANLEIGIWMDYGHEALVNLSGLEKLKTIGGSLLIHNADDLITLSNLRTLTTIDGDIYITGNYSLDSLSGLDNIDPESIQNLSIIGNNSLTNCEVQSICDYLAAPNGVVYINNNAPGCDSIEEVEYACQTVWVEERNPSSQPIIVYPNPFTTLTTISYRLHQPSNVQISIYNHLGQQVHFIQQNQSQGKQQVTWDASGQPAGVYYFQMKAGDQLATGKLMLVK